MERRNFLRTTAALGGVVLASSSGSPIVGDRRVPRSTERIEVDETSAIQQAIDELTEPNADGSRGGTVELEPGVYTPETTIWLKAGVTLEGSTTNQRFSQSEFPTTEVTVISTENLDREPTFAHNADHKHPHYPLVANYRTPPLELDERDPTEEEIEYWGHSVGLKNVLLDASQRKYWKEDDYFGAYDATIFSRSHNLRLQNVETRGFDGYGGFVNGCRNVRDVGSVWRGGATDYHCSALTLHTAYPPDPTVYTTGVWDVDVAGPPPTLETFTHDISFVSGGWSGAEIRATEYRFVKNPEAYWNGEAPLTDPRDGKTVYKYEHGDATLDGYTVTGFDNRVDGIWTGDTRLEVANSSIENVRYGIHSPVRVFNSSISNATVGLLCGSHYPDVSELTIADTDIGVRVSGHASAAGTLSDVRFEEVSTGITGRNDEPVVLENPDFRGADTPVEWTEHDDGWNLRLVDPVGYRVTACGEESFSGESHSFDHGLDEPPVHVEVSPTSASTADANWYWTTDGSVVTVAFSDRLSDGSFSWRAYGRSAV